MKKIISSLLVLVVVISMVGCSNNSKKLVTDKYYLASLLGEGYGAGAVVMKFYEDGSVQLVDAGLGRKQDERKSYYASYTIEESSITIKYSNEEHNGVVLEDGDKIAFGEIIFKVNDNLDEKTLIEFK